MFLIPELSPHWLPLWSLYSMQPALSSRLGQGSPPLPGCCSMWRTRTLTEGWHGLAQPLQMLQPLTAQSWATKKEAPTGQNKGLLTTFTQAPIIISTQRKYDYWTVWQCMESWLQFVELVGFFVSPTNRFSLPSEHKFTSLCLIIRLWCCKCADFVATGL